MDSVVETLKEQLKSEKVAVKFVNVDWMERKQAQWPHFLIKCF